MDTPPVKTVDRGKEEVTKLCQYFTTNRQAFLAPGVKEAHIRQSLIDPLFEALGWDVGNKAMTAPQYREVIPEDSLDVEGQQKAPDYTFRVGSLPKFYAEAKKCGVNIGADPAPAFQLRRYGWSAKLALSILTDFEELSVYDCTMRPRPSEKASHARIKYFHFGEYPDRWRELWDMFSREAVWSGAFDQYAASKRKRGTSEVDVEFLKEIERWRPGAPCVGFTRGAFDFCGAPLFAAETRAHPFFPVPIRTDTPLSRSRQTIYQYLIDN